MPNVSGFVYYDPTFTSVPGTGIPSVPVALYNPGSGIGAVALTDATGAYTFTNVPAGNYYLIESWGTAGAATPVNFATAAAMAQPPEVEPPLSAVPAIPPPLADKLNALTPNLLKITVAGTNLVGQNFYDAPVGNKPIVFSGVSFQGGNLITAAANGTWGTYPGGQPINSTLPSDPYPGVTSGLSYSTSTVPSDGVYTIMNTRGVSRFPWWEVSDHTTGIETGRYLLVNGSNPGAAIFSQPVAVTPNTDYALTAWILNLLNSPGFADPKLALQVLDGSGNQIFFQNVNPISATAIPVWYQNGFLFNTGANSNITVRILSEGPAANGNDYLIDDVALHKVVISDILSVKKTATPAVIHPGDDVTITVTVTNNSTTDTANPVMFKDVLDPSLTFVPGSVTVDTYPNAGNPNTGFSLGSMGPLTNHIVVFHATAGAGASPVKNTATGSYPMLASATGDTVLKTITSNPVFLRRPLYDFRQASNDLAESVAYEQSALSHILNAEGEKIQAALAIPQVTPAQLLAVNTSVQDMIDSVSDLECVLRSKLKIVKNQLVGYQTL
ncbi:MAG: carboxypeptidase-like regulatory domain-containing protein [Clostridia bacterium]